MYSWFCGRLNLIVDKTRILSNMQNHGSKSRIALKPKMKGSLLTTLDCWSTGLYRQRNVSNILKKQRLTGSVKDLKIPERKRKTTKSEDWFMLKKCKSDCYKTATENKAEMQIEHSGSVSISAARRRLREAGPNSLRPNYYLHHKWAVLLTASVFRLISLSHFFSLGSQLNQCQKSYSKLEFTVPYLFGYFRSSNPSLTSLGHSQGFFLQHTNL